MTQKGDPQEDIKSRLGKTRAAFNKLRNIWKSGQLKLNTKLKIFHTNVIAVILYGRETWRMTKSNAIKLGAFLHKNLRGLKKISWPMEVQLTPDSSNPR